MMTAASVTRAQPRMLRTSRSGQLAASCETEESDSLTHHASSSCAPSQGVTQRGTGDSDGSAAEWAKQRAGRGASETRGPRGPAVREPGMGAAWDGRTGERLGWCTKAGCTTHHAPIRPIRAPRTHQSSIRAQAATGPPARIWLFRAACALPGPSGYLALPDSPRTREGQRPPHAAPGAHPRRRVRRASRPRRRSAAVQGRGPRGWPAASRPWRGTRPSSAHTRWGTGPPTSLSQRQPRDSCHTAASSSPATPDRSTCPPSTSTHPKHLANAPQQPGPACCRMWRLAHMREWGLHKALAGEQCAPPPPPPPPPPPR